MIKSWAFIILFFYITSEVWSQGFLQHYNSLGINLGVVNYHSPVLDNRENKTNYLSFSTAVSYNSAISPLFNFNQMLQFGNLQNASNNEPFWNKSQFLSYNIGFSLNLFKFFDRKFDAKLVPFLNTGYGFNYFLQTSASRPNPIVSNFKVGAGASYAINDYLAAFVQYNIHQRLGNDFKTGIESQFGLLATLVKKQ